MRYTPVAEVVLVLLKLEDCDMWCFFRVHPEIQIGT